MDYSHSAAVRKQVPLPRLYSLVRTKFSHPQLAGFKDDRLLDQLVLAAFAIFQRPGRTKALFRAYFQDSNRKGVNRPKQTSLYSLRFEWLGGKRGR